MSDVNTGSTDTPNGAGSSSGGDAGGFAAVDAAAAPDGGDKTGAGDPGADQDDAGSRLRASLNKIADRADEIRAWGMDRQEAARDAARDLVDAKPLTVVGAAFGIGLLLGLVASRV